MKESFKIVNNNEGYNDIIHSLPDIVFKIDLKGNFTYLNEAVRKLGYIPDELIGIHFKEIIHPDDLNSVMRSVVLEKLKKSESGNDEHPRLFDERRTGDRITKNLRIRLAAKAIDKKIEYSEYEIIAIGLYTYKKNNNTYNGTIGLIRDIQEIKRSEEAVVHTEMHYRLLIENSSDIITILANDGTILYKSDSIRRILGYEPVDLIGDNEYKIIHKDEINKLKNILEQEISRDDKIISTEYKLRHADGSWRVFESTIRKILDDENEIICSVINSHDITKFKKTEMDLRESENRFRGFFEDSPISLWEKDFTGIKKYIRKLKLTGNKDIREYCKKHQDKIVECANLIEILNVNRATLDLVEAKDLQDLKDNIEKIYTAELYNTLKDAIISVDEGSNTFESYSAISTLTSKKKNIYLKGFIASKENSAYSKVLISMLDVTDLKNVEDDLFKQWLLINSINRVFITAMVCENLEDIIETSLKESCDITESEFSFFAELNKQGELEKYILNDSGKVEKITSDDFNIPVNQIEIKKIWDKLVKDRHTLIVYDTENHPDLIKSNNNSLKSFICSPLIFKDKNIGVLGIANKKIDYTFFDQQSLESISVSFLEALNSKKYEINLMKAMEELTALYQISSLISKIMNMDELFPNILKAITGQKIFNYPKTGGIFMNKNDRLLPVASIGNIDDFACIHNPNNPKKSSCMISFKKGTIIQEKKCKYIEKHKTDKDKKNDHGHLIIPLKASNVTVGVLGLYMDPDFKDLNERQIQVVSSIGHQIGIAIQNLNLYEETKRLSLHDPLTGLANRRNMEKAFTDNLALSKRYNRTFSILMLDIDFFKKYNDTYGHSAGDKILSDVAKVLNKEVRDVDLVTRYGGEEFLIMLPEIELKEASMVAERIRASIEKSTDVTISIGVSVYNDKIVNKKNLIDNADLALYKAKENGRNRVEIFHQK